jgi:hypothetical protein
MDAEQQPQPQDEQCYEPPRADDLETEHSPESVAGMISISEIPTGPAR